MATSDYPSHRCSHIATRRFEDFAATVLSLAGLDTPSYMTGQAFLGSKAAPPRTYQYSFRSNFESTGSQPEPDRGIKAARSVFDGRLHYVRSYMPFAPEAAPQSYQWQMPGEGSASDGGFGARLYAGLPRRAVPRRAGAAN
jgi:hypothetical protein